MARIPYVDKENLPLEIQPLLDTLSDKTDEVEDRGHALQGETLNVYRLMANNVDLLSAFQTYGSAVWTKSGLSSHEREFVILTVAYQTRSAYEWHQHVRVALNEGMTANQIRAVSNNELDSLVPKYGAIVEYVGCFVNGSVDDTTHERIKSYYDDDAILGIGMLAGNYLGLSRLIDATDVETEVKFVGWNLENL